MARRRNDQPEPSAPTAGAQRTRRPSAERTGARQSARRQPFAEPVTGLVLRQSPARRKLLQREQEHERLLQQIARAKARCDALESLIRDAQALLHARAEGLRERVTASLRELHRALDALLGKRSRLRRSDRLELQLFCQEFLGGLPRPEDLDPAPAEREQSSSTEREEGEREGEAGAAGSSWAEPPGERLHASATKPGKDAELLRSLYRKLTLALHPDRASDPAEAARLTALMKELTRAYAEQDLAQLMEMERTWLAQSASDAEQELEARAARLQAANRELRGQLRQLAARLKEGQHWLPDGSWTQRDGPADARELAARIGEMLQRELRQVEGWRDAALALAAGQISLLQFMLGPRSALEEDEVLDALDELLEGARRARPGPRSGSRR